LGGRDAGSCLSRDVRVKEGYGVGRNSGKAIERPLSERVERRQRVGSVSSRLSQAATGRPMLREGGRDPFDGWRTSSFRGRAVFHPSEPWPTGLGSRRHSPEKIERPEPVLNCPTAGCGSLRRLTSVAEIERPPSCRSPAQASCRDCRRRASANRRHQFGRHAGGEFAGLAVRARPGVVVRLAKFVARNRAIGLSSAQCMQGVSSPTLSFASGPSMHRQAAGWMRRHAQASGDKS
jgi:hypothetical protein